MEKITVDFLEAKGACRKQVEKFKELFPNGPEMTVEQAVAVATEFDWGWIAMKLLNRENYLKYVGLCFDAEEISDANKKPFFEDYQSKSFGLRDQYDMGRITYDEYLRADNVAYREYLQLVDPYKVVQKQARAKAFATLYLEQEAAHDEVQSNRHAAA